MSECRARAFIVRVGGDGLAVPNDSTAAGIVYER